MRAEPGRLGQQRLHVKRRAQIVVQRILIVARVNHMLNHDVLTQPRHVMLLQKVHNRIAVGPCRLRPVRVRTKIWHRREYVERFAAFRRKFRIHMRGPVEVEREILRQMMPVEDVVEQPLVPFAQNDVVLHKIAIVVAPVEAQVKHHQRHTVALTPQLGVSEVLAMPGRNQFVVGIGHISVGNHRIGAAHLPIGHPHTHHLTALNQNLRHFGIQLKRAAKLCKELRHRRNNRPYAAHRMMHAPLPLQIIHHRVD